MGKQAVPGAARRGGQLLRAVLLGSLLHDDDDDDAVGGCRLRASRGCQLFYSKLF